MTLIDCIKTIKVILEIFYVVTLNMCVPSYGKIEVVYLGKFCEPSWEKILSQPWVKKSSELVPKYIFGPKLGILLSQCHRPTLGQFSKNEYNFPKMITIFQK